MVEQTPLQSLYPFLQKDSRDNAAIDPALLESVQQKTTHHLRIVEDFFAANSRDLIAAARTLAHVYLRDGRLLTMGNGGSSCDAAHVAVEFLHPVTAGRPALCAINLCSEVAMLSAVGNDLGFEHAFVRQLIAHGREGDCLLGFSTSGNSENLLRAFAKAREMGLVTIGLAGGDGGGMARAGLEHCLVVPTDSIHRVQETHVAIYHILWDLVHSLLADERGGLHRDRREPGE